MRLAVLVALLGACGGGKGGSLEGPCGGLSLFECRLTDGCVPDICGGCFCGLGYRGCISEVSTPDECPQLGCPSAPCCRTEAECEGQGTCSVPGADDACGGPCDSTPGDCADDTACSGTTICEPIACSCSGELRCVAGCLSDDDCVDPGTSCDLETSRCVAAACTVAEDCPVNFDCLDARCVRRSCTDDLDCDGFCVLDQCFSGALGECRLPAP